ncbi:DUF6704 family protein [Arsenicicoccus sp. oral taxon 190]|uniref:DUF6704 family protein n=1 Tax=Arsenicicoccus sp. oral taxon 190 TaxID=1658671 RepID=UPI000679EC14|nr:DUF6704 family protein [Arsenicicoccus sp. oral taxon 190]AKT51739.1 hypothetical protein ADJ73_11395 [Arsenicicoccus sp. oral taxon 190]
MEDRPQSAPSANERATHDAHGQSIAAWATVGVLLLGSLVLSVAVIFAHWVWIAVGALIVLAGPVVGIALSRAGYGAGGAKDSFTNSPHR